ncbi:MAG TPA: S-methyl-5-thioribose-1-phosphate isomerase, partial [Hyphomicrobiaceae bacterium]|nr:S-methyl-5-thioribose-1-phosphate isomerase [Hyphomicrobiaceae bacterium]
MRIAGRHYRTIWPTADGRAVEIIDQTRLPHQFVTKVLATADEAARAIKTMEVRGAPLIGATAAYGLAMALRRDPSDRALEASIEHLASQRPTAVNLRWALDEMRKAVAPLAPTARANAAWLKAAAICDDDVETCRRIGEHGLGLIKAAAKRKAGKPVNILTHCNPGWLATVDYGTATAPIYLAQDEGLPVHVWVDE